MIFQIFYFSFRFQLLYELCLIRTTTFTSRTTATSRRSTASPWSSTTPSTDRRARQTGMQRRRDPKQPPLPKVQAQQEMCPKKLVIQGN